ncbi:isopenicillin N synthase family dioxygenase [Gayadomonas joobiniege]|uniref:isopenicillin N synthase family dioxygenase n=1 Tax=Gayadomonas joobiniege TaxID=1234606 RepID=UPI0003759931|nr:2OG-Fe(II) oxygenase family protein [Gayadomonas joobiniege]
MTIKKNYQLDELNFETKIGGQGIENDDFEIPIIDMSDFDERREIITEQLWEAAAEVGFFQLIHHGIPISEIEHAFAQSEAYFALPAAVKNKNALKAGQNAGWEFKSQIRPSTGTQDQKESFQITVPNMTGCWPSDTVLLNFRRDMLAFEDRCWRLGMQVLSCFADKLGFPVDFFSIAHDKSKQDYQSTLRLLHYLPMKTVPNDPKLWRAGAHTDFDCLTMVFQKEGQGGLQVCAGKNAKEQQSWTNAVPRTGVITCNIGDMLMRWSDDKLKSTLHRVRMPKPEESQASRYSMAFFCQANKKVVIEGPAKKYPAMTAEEYLQLRINANFNQN